MTNKNWPFLIRHHWLCLLLTIHTIHWHTDTRVLAETSAGGENRDVFTRVTVDEMLTFSAGPRRNLHIYSSLCVCIYLWRYVCMCTRAPVCASIFRHVDMPPQAVFLCVTKEMTELNCQFALAKRGKWCGAWMSLCVRMCVSSVWVHF